MTKAKMKHRILAFMLCLTMVFGDFSTVFAAEPNTETTVVPETVSQQETETPPTVEEQEPETPQESSGETEESSEEEGSVEETTTEEVTEIETVIEETETETETVTETPVLDTADGTEGKVVVLVDYNESIVADTLQEAITEVNQKVASGEISENSTVQITLNDDVSVGGDDLFRTTNVDKKIIFMLCLNGHTVNVTDDATISGWQITGSAASQGTINVDKDATLTIEPTYIVDSSSEGCTTKLSALSIKFDATSEKNTSLVIGNSALNTKVKINEVKINELASPIQFRGNVEIDATNIENDFVVETNYGQRVKFQRNAFINAKEIELKGTMALQCDMYVDNFIVRRGECLELQGTAQIQDITFTEENYGLQYGLLIDLQTTTCTPDNSEKKGNVIFFKPVILPENLSKAVVFKKSTRTMDTNSTEDVSYQTSSFENDEKLASLFESPSVTGSDVFGILDEEELTPIRIGNELRVAEKCVTVKYYSGNGGTKEVSYESFKAAVDGLSTDFGGQEGRYEFSIVNDCRLQEDIVVPSFVDHIDIEAGEVGYDSTTSEILKKVVTIDFNGHSISTVNGSKTSFFLYEGVYIKDSTESGNSKFNIYIQEGYSALGIFAKRNNEKLVVPNSTAVSEEDKWLAAERNGKNIVENVAINIPNSFMTLNGGNMAEDAYFCLPSQISVGAIMVESGNWKVDGNVNIRGLSVSGAREGVNEAKVIFDILNIGLGTCGIDIRGYVEANEFKTNTYVMHIYPTGTLKVNNDITLLKNSPIYNEGIIEAKNIKAEPASLAIFTENTGVIKADSFIVPSGEFRNGTDYNVTRENKGIADIGTMNIKNFTNGTVGESDGSIFICDDFVQTAGGKTNLEPYSAIVVNNSAKIYNPVIGGERREWGNAGVKLYKKPGATVDLQGNVVRKNDTLTLDYGLVDTQGEERFSYKEEDFAITLKEISQSEVLFTTTMAKFPLDWINLEQASAEVGMCQQGKSVCAGTKGIFIYTRATEGANEELIMSFMLWSDAAAYINTLSNAAMTYVVKLSDNVYIDGPLTFPTKAAGIEFVGATGKVDLTYKGDISLTTDTVFENINLKALNAKTGAEGYNSIVKLNGKNLILRNANAEFASVTGTATSDFFVDGRGNEYDRPVVTVTGAISSLKHLIVYGAELEIGANLKPTATALNNIEILDANDALIRVNNGATNIRGDVTLDYAEFRAVGKITFGKSTRLNRATINSDSMVTLADVETLNDNNFIYYGGNTSTSILTITGNVYGSASGSEYYGDVKIYGPNGEGKYVIGSAEAGQEHIIRKAAITICPHTVEYLGYEQDTLLLNAPKAQAEWFVVGSEFNPDAANIPRVRVNGLTHKKGTTIVYGALENENVVLKVRDYSEAENAAPNYAVYGSYETLQEAFDEIERIGNIEGEYLIQLKDGTAATDVNKGKDLTTPAKAGHIVICSDDKQPILYKSKLTLKTYLALDNVEIVPQMASNSIALNDYWLEFTNGTIINNEGKTTAVAGSGVTKNSGISVYGCNDLFTFSALTNVGNLYLEGAEIQVNGVINIGNVEVKHTGEGGRISTLAGLATVTRAKDGTISKIVPQITINGSVYGDDVAYLELQEKQTVSGVISYVPIDFSSEEADNLLNAAGIQIAKAPLVSSEKVTVSSENGTGNVSGTLTKAAGYLVYRGGLNAISLCYEDENGNSVETSCRTFAEAVTEINNLKTKRDYEMHLLENAVGEASLAAPAVLTMPNKSYVNTLTITGWDDGMSTPVNLHYLNNITLSSNVILGDINFVQVVKNPDKTDTDNPYIPVDEVKAGYPALVTVNTAGNALTVEGTVTFNTPINLNGGTKGILSVEGGSIGTLTNGIAEGDLENKNIICGSVTGFAEVNLSGTDFEVTQYVTEGKPNKYTAANFQTTTLNLNSGLMQVGYGNEYEEEGTEENVLKNAGGNATIKSANLSNGTLEVNGKAALTNVTLSRDSEIKAEKDFNITGTLTSTTSNATLISRRKSAKNPVPYLNITGTVVLEDADSHRIQVGVMAAADEEDPDAMAKLEKAPNAPNPTAELLTAQLLTAKTATAEMFKPMFDNVQSEAYSDANAGGYILAKTGANIYVYYGDEVGAALCKEEVTDLSEALANGKLLAYYPTYKDAVTALEARKDKTAEYTILLLQDIGSEEAAAALTMPKTAAKVTIACDIEGDVAKNIYYTGNITLGTKTSFINVVFQPVKKSGSSYVGAVSDITTGVNDLYLTNVTVGETSGMALRNISGNAKQSTYLSSKGLTLSGSVLNSKEVCVSEAATINGNVKATTVRILTTTGEDRSNVLTVNGTFTTDFLELENGTSLDAQKNAVTIKDISYGEGNRITYGSNAKGAPNLTIKGEVSTETGATLELNLIPSDTAKTADAYALKINEKNAAQVALNDGQKLAVIEKAPLSTFTMKLNDSAVKNENADYEVVKANKGVYVVKNDSPAAVNTVVLDGNMGSTVCLDFSQAVNEMNSVNDAEAEYTIKVDGDITDTNVTDASGVSALTLPKANTASNLVISSIMGNNIRFSGNISYVGTLSICSVVLNPVSAKEVPTNVAITVTKDKKGNAGLVLEGVTTVADQRLQSEDPLTAGFISKITGTKDVTNLAIVDSNFRLTDGITNVDTLKLENAGLTTGGAVTINNLDLNQQYQWDAFGKTTVSNIRIDGSVTDDSYIASKQTAKTLVPQFTVNGSVNNATGKQVVYKVISADKTMADPADEIYVDTYKDVSLVIAPKASADMFVAYPFADDDDTNDEDINIAAGDLVSYKDTTNAVKNGDKADMIVRVTKNGTSVTHAKSFDEAVTVINNFADSEAEYTIEILQAGTAETPSEIKTAKSGTAYGALTLPKKAKNVTISGSTDGGEPTAVICYTGKLQPTCNVTFEDILLTEGTAKVVSGESVFTPSYEVTPVVAGAYTLTFDGKAGTLKNDSASGTEAEADLVFSSVSGTKGTINIVGESNLASKKVYVKGALSINALEMTGYTEAVTEKDITITALSLDSKASLEGKGKLTVKELTVTNHAADNAETAVLKAEKAMALTDIQGENLDADDALLLETCFTTITNATQQSLSQLSINGSIEDVQVNIATEMYDLATKSYHKMNMDEAKELNVVNADMAPAKTQKIATMPKASVANVAVYAADNTDSWKKLENIDFSDNGGVVETVYNYKYDSGLYITTSDPVVRLEGEIETTVGESTGRQQIYSTEFLSWEQAVKEIDRIANPDMYYKLVLLKDVGSIAPITELTLPSKAAEVIITSENGRNIYFTKTAITLKCNTVFDNVGLMAVKKMGTGADIWYESTGYNITVGNFSLTEQNVRRGTQNEDMNRAYFENMPNIISGTAKGSFTFKKCDTGVDDNDYLYAPATKITNVGTVTFLNKKGEEEIPTTVDGEGKTVEDREARNARRVWLDMKNGMSGVTSLILYPDTEINCGAGDISVKNLTLAEESRVSAKNLTVTGITTLKNSDINTGTDTIGDGKVKLANVVIAGNDNHIRAKQDKNGKSQLEITGTITCAENYMYDPDRSAICVGIRYNNSSEKYAKLYDGMTLLTAPKATSSWFGIECNWTPGENETGEPVEGMGEWTDGYDVYKSGKEIKYGKWDFEAVLETSTGAKSNFATFEEAVKEIDSLALYKPGTKEYEDYAILLVQDVHIGNDKGNGAYSALSLPSKVSELNIIGDGTAIYFSGNVTLKSNLYINGVNLQPRKAVKGEAVATKANYNVGKYCLSMCDTWSYAVNNNPETGEPEGQNLFGNVSGTKGGSLVIIGQPDENGTVAEPYYVEVDNISGAIDVEICNEAVLRVNGNLALNNLKFTSSSSYENGELDVNGTFSANLIEKDGLGVAKLVKPLGKDMKIVGDKQTEKAIIFNHAKSESPELNREFINVTVKGAGAPGTKVMSGGYVNIEELEVYDSDEIEYQTYKSGSDIFMGTPMD